LLSTFENSVHVAGRCNIVDALKIFIYDVNFFLDFAAQILALKLFSFWVIVPSVSARLLLELRFPLVVENPLFF